MPYKNAENCPTINKMRVSAFDPLPANLLSQSYRKSKTEFHDGIV